MTTTCEIVYWRDIPAQVKARAGRQRATKPLSERFQQAIDIAAMRLLVERHRRLPGRVGDVAEPVSVKEEPEKAVEALAAELERAFTPERLSILANGGRGGRADPCSLSRRGAGPLTGAGKRVSVRDMSWIQNHPAVEVAYARTHAMLRPFGRWLRRGGAVERLFVAGEKLTKGPVFDCRMCGQCILHKRYDLPDDLPEDDA